MTTASTSARLQGLLLASLMLWVALVGGTPDPDPKTEQRASVPVLLLDVTLPAMTPKQYLDSYWHNTDFYKDFLEESGTV